MANSAARSVRGWFYALVVAVALILLFVAGEQYSRIKRPGYFFSPRTTTLSVAMRPRNTVRIVAEPIPLEMEPSEHLVNRSRWVDYRTEAPTSIALAEPPAGVKLTAPISDQFIDPFPEFAARPRLAMSEQESQDSITANAVSAIRTINDPSNTISSNHLSSKTSVIGNTWPVALQMQSELNDFREIQVAECTLPIREELRAWNDRTIQIFESLESIAITDPRSLELLGELSELSEQGFSWATLHVSDSPSLASALNRVSYSVKRRVVVWTAVHECKRIGRERFVAIRSYDVDYNKLQDRLETVRRALISTDDVENWGRYLMLDRIEDLAHQRIESRENQVGLAREFLARVTDSRVTPDQRRILTSAEVHRLADQVHPLTIGPVDYRKILIDIEALESNPVHRCSADLADAIQSLRFSEHPEQASVADIIGTHYRNANIRMSVSEAFINRMMPQGQVSNRPVQQRILGADTRGASQASTNLKVDFIPDPSAWHVALNLDGQIDSNTRSSRNGATFYNATKAHVQASRDIRIDSTSLQIDGKPATVESSDSLRKFSTSWDSMPVLGEMIRYVAHQEFVQSRPIAKRLTQKLIAKQTDQEFDSQLKTNIEAARSQFDKRLLGPLQSLQLQPLVLDMQTTENRLVVRYRVAGANQISAYTPRPVAPGDSLISLQLHQSAFNNLISQAIDTTRDWTIQDLAAQIADVLQQTRPELPDDTPNDVVIRFMEHNPMTVEFEDNRMWLTLRIASLEQPGRILLKNFTIRTSFAPSIDGIQADVVRDGVISIDGHKIGVRDRLPLRAIFTKVFSGRTSMPMVSQELANDPRAKGLAVSQLEMRDGWFAIAVSEAEAASVAAFKASQTFTR
ncbi:MAG: hypothetical protein ACK5O8_14705 [Pirellula sp.]|jgi:hypothetical protein